jgi:hypothetical protein
MNNNEPDGDMLPDNPRSPHFDNSKWQKLYDEEYERLWDKDNILEVDGDIDVAVILKLVAQNRYDEVALGSIVKRYVDGKVCNSADYIATMACEDKDG